MTDHPGPVHRARRTRVAGAGGAAVLALLGGCGGNTFPEAPPVVAVTMAEYRFGMAGTVPRGRVVFRVTNRGGTAHDLTMVSIPDDFPLTIGEQLRSRDREAFRTRAHLAVRQPGKSGTFAMDLAPGRYGIVCFVMGPGGETHARMGMSAEFRVR